MHAEYYLFLKERSSFCVNHSEQVLKLLEFCFSLKFRTSQISARFINLKLHRVFSFISYGKYQNFCKDCYSIEKKINFVQLSTM